MKEVILEAMHEAAEQTSSELIQDIDGNTVLLESGLDSLGFAILVALLEEKLGYDPFALMDEPIYPRILREFIEIYQQFAP